MNYTSWLMKMQNLNCTIICFDYGGYYMKDEAEIKWISGGGEGEDEIHTIVLRKSMEDILETEMSKRCVDAGFLTIDELNSFHLEYSVHGTDGKVYTVDMARNTCSCEQFDKDKYPCVHGVAAATFMSKAGEGNSIYQSIVQNTIWWSNGLWLITGPYIMFLICLIGLYQKMLKQRKYFLQILTRRKENHNKQDFHQ
ncbi:hypothetical protein YC2023_039100 [Brassica napus]